MTEKYDSPIRLYFGKAAITDGMDLKPAEDMLMDMRETIGKAAAEAANDLDNTIMIKIRQTCDVDIDKEKMLQIIQGDRRRCEDAYDRGYRQGCYLLNDEERKLLGGILEDLQQRGDYEEEYSDRDRGMIREIYQKLTIV